ncbi:DUF4306 domain-containing protein [Gracilibacillus alcaliphilus]|uniref:DUF4306 domain-containing protein n=1 Tax=Gracilibacillus alcaliphilus TaxID=1401441 RepID=UPI00195D2649|nr:hypothetical protein [Gracilibacillus alcaliphilus]
MDWITPIKGIFAAKSKLFIQLAVSFSFFWLALFASLYEGSYLLHDSSEWEHTPFTHLLHNNPNLPSDISQLDFLVYAIKFYSFFPIICLISGLYFLTASLFALLQKNHLLFRKLFLIIGLLLCVTAVFLFSTLTIGTILFCTILFLFGGGLVGFFFVLRKGG